MSEQLDKAFEALKTYDWGMDPNVLQPIDEAIVSTHGDAAARKDLETRLAAVLKTEASRAAKDVVCRALKTIGTAASVPALAALLADEKLSHMARYALERIPAPEAGQALRTALPKVTGKLKIGMISSLGVRGEEASLAPLQALLADSDAAVAQAAAHALGDDRFAGRSQGPRHRQAQRRDQGRHRRCLDGMRGKPAGQRQQGGRKSHLRETPRRQSIQAG